jgi:transcriptional regulator with XRE-family HTH domain
MTMFGDVLRRLRAEREITLGQFALLIHYNKGYLSRVESGKQAPSETLARQCDNALNARGELIAAAHLDIAAARDTKPSLTTELLSRIHAGDVPSSTVESIQATIFDLCCQYAHRDAVELRNEAHDWLREIARSLRQQIGLKQHQEMLVAAGWLALLVGCIEYDLGMRAGAEATRVTAAQLGSEAGANEIVAWSYEMSAWFALTQGHYRSVLDSASTGIAIAGQHGVAVQLAGQQAKAFARMGDITGVRASLDHGRSLLDGVSWTVRTDHHFAVDPGKWNFYAMDAYRLAGDDQLATEYAHEVLRQGTTPDGSERSPMRMSEARLTLATTYSRKGNLDGAISTAMAALDSSRRSLPSLLMVAGELDAELQRRWPDESAVENFREALRSVH